MTALDVPRIGVGTRVFFAARKSAFRVGRFTELRGERAVELVDPANYRLITDPYNKEPVQVRRTIAVADLMYDPDKRAYRERWQQQEMFE